MPSLSVLFGKRSLNSIISSFRSITLRDSHHSRVAPHNSKSNPRPYEVLGDDNNTTSQAYMVPEDNVGVESFAIGNLEEGQGDRLNEGKIHVKNVICQEDNAA